MEELIVKCKVDLFSDLCAQLSDEGLGALLATAEEEVRIRASEQPV